MKPRKSEDKESKNMDNHMILSSLPFTDRPTICPNDSHISQIAQRQSSQTHCYTHQSRKVFLNFTIIRISTRPVRLCTKASSLASCVASSRRRPAARTRGNRVATLPARRTTTKTSKKKTFKALFDGWVLVVRVWNACTWNGRGIGNMYCKNPQLCICGVL